MSNLNVLDALKKAIEEKIVSSKLDALCFLCGYCREYDSSLVDLFALIYHLEDC